MTVNLFNKDAVNITKFINLYGEKETKNFLKETVEENHEILENIKKDSLLKEIKEKSNGNIDLASSIGNFFIENKMKDVIIDSMNEELDEKELELDNVKKENYFLKNIVDKESEMFKNSIEMNKNNTKMFKKLIGTRKTYLRRCKKK